MVVLWQIKIVEIAMKKAPVTTAIPRHYAHLFA